MRERGVPEVALRGCAGDGEPLPGVTARRWSGAAGSGRAGRPGRGSRRAPRRPGCRFVCPGDAEWPGQLDDLGTPRPLGLWVRGRPCLRLWALRSVAVVGARACTDYGAHMAATLGCGPRRTRAGWWCPAAAYGVDGAAHRGALAAGGATVAVLACGVDRPYPRGQRRVDRPDRRTGSGGRGVAAGRPPDPSRFVLRNRVIAALTRGTVVVEAALPQRLAGHRPPGGAAAGPASPWACPARPPAGCPQGCTNCCAARRSLVTDAAEVVELVGEIGRPRPGPARPGAAARPAGPGRARVLEALPGRGGADARARSPARPGTDTGRHARPALRIAGARLRRTTRRRLEVGPYRQAMVSARG